MDKKTILIFEACRGIAWVLAKRPSKKKLFLFYLRNQSKLFKLAAKLNQLKGSTI
ncbi:hypothetical protein [Candidatus Protochlamydia sp. W-9]|uniref:hypothetical protein n=1 Tax=Candidatus Protochlamydia sp. W-9 TaxID=1785087 RepID=UPI0013018055|nr:hypothetical protein [Candidatus Protochlamydia sp. W-9]